VGLYAGEQISVSGHVPVTGMGDERR